jgi:hypothetical protein
MSSSQNAQVARFSPKRLAAPMLVSAVLLAGCATNTETGAVTGAGLGGLGGAIIGSAAHAPLAGAAIGAAAGALTGAAIGNSEDKREAKAQAHAVAVSIQAQQDGMNEIARMTSQRVAEDVIVNYVRTSPVVYNLAANQIEWLHQSGVSDAVIREMQNTLLRVPGRVYVEGPVYGPPVVVAEPPPVAVGVGFGYTHYRRW